MKPHEGKPVGFPGIHKRTPPVILRIGSAMDNVSQKVGKMKRFVLGTDLTDIRRIKRRAAQLDAPPGAVLSVSSSEVFLQDADDDGKYAFFPGCVMPPASRYSPMLEALATDSTEESGVSEAGTSVSGADRADADNDVEDDGTDVLMDSKKNVKKTYKISQEGESVVLFSDDREDETEMTPMIFGMTRTCKAACYQPESVFNIEPITTSEMTGQILGAESILDDVSGSTDEGDTGSSSYSDEASTLFGTVLVEVGKTHDSTEDNAMELTNASNAKTQICWETVETDSEEGSGHGSQDIDISRVAPSSHSRTTASTEKQSNLSSHKLQIDLGDESTMGSLNDGDSNKASTFHQLAVVDEVAAMTTKLLFTLRMSDPPKDDSGDSPQPFTTKISVSTSESPAGSGPDKEGDDSDAVSPEKPADATNKSFTMPEEEDEDEDEDEGESGNSQQTAATSFFGGLFSSTRGTASPKAAPSLSLQQPQEEEDGKTESKLDEGQEMTSNVDADSASIVAPMPTGGNTLQQLETTQSTAENGIEMTWSSVKAEQILSSPTDTKRSRRRFWRFARKRGRC